MTPNNTQEPSTSRQSIVNHGGQRITRHATASVELRSARFTGGQSIGYQ